MDIKQKLGEALQENVPLKNYSTFQLGGPAKYFFTAKSNKDIVKATQATQECNLPFFILGGGSNILVNDSGFDGLVIKTENRGINLEGDIIKAESGALLGQAVNLAMQNSMSGLEWAIGIPGTIGGAVYGNAGAFGKCTADNVSKVEVLKINGDKTEIVTMPKEECGYEYRESIFKKQKDLIILGAELKVAKGEQDEIKKLMLENSKGRVVTPYPNVGCSFKNLIVTDEIRRKIREIDPEGEAKIKGGKIGTGWFIDQAGLKGHQIGGAKISNEHANYIVKVSEDGTANDVVMLISYIKQQVRTKCGIQLQEEINYIGF